MAWTQWRIIAWFTSSGAVRPAISRPSKALSRARNSSSVTPSPLGSLAAAPRRPPRRTLAPGLTGLPHHPQTGGGHDLAQHFHHPAAERVDLRGAAGALDVAGEHCAR